MADRNVPDEARRRGQYGIGRMHHGLGLPGRARRIDQLDGIVGRGTASGKARLLGWRQGRALQKGALEGGFAAAADREKVLQPRQFGADLLQHAQVIKAAPGLRHDGDLGLAETQHET